MFVAYKRNHMYGKMIGSLIHAFFTSPKDFLNECFSFAKNIVTYKD